MNGGGRVKEVREGRPASSRRLAARSPETVMWVVCDEGADLTS
ncbi:hypothetical protein A2U01_0020384, partial [Trifolium medium]|nr:hypothetical protein [Trifolium medium]